MDAGLHGAKKVSKKPKRDKHGWNSYENYKALQDDCLANHPFIERSETPLLEVFPFEYEGELFLYICGEIHCCNNVIVSITKYLETKETKGGRLMVRCFSYRYNAKISGEYTILRYDNGHTPDDYHRHVFNVNTGDLLTRESLCREDFPILPEILDELEGMFD